jgi:AraC-like DNA-binding protein
VFVYIVQTLAIKPYPDMLKDIRSKPESHFHFEEVLPPSFKGPVLLGSRIMTAKGKYGQLILQEIANDSYNIQFGIFQFFRKIKLTFNEENAFLHARVALKNRFSFRAKEISRIEIKPGQYCIFHPEQMQSEALFEKGKVYHMIDINYSKQMISEVADLFPKLNQFLSKVDKGKSFALRKPHWMVTEARDLIHGILHAPYEKDIQQYYFDLIIKQNLFHLLIQQFYNDTETKDFGAQEDKKIIEMAAMLSNHMDKYFPISELAKSVQMNKNNLESRFKKIHGKSVFKFHRDTRLEQAKRMIIVENIPIKQVYSLAGYKSIMSFIHEFGKKFGYSPGSLLKKKK